MEDITAEYATTDLLELVPLRVRTRVSVGAKTDLGRVRENNEDKFEFFIPEDDETLARRGMVFMVCDGMGGHAGGQFASELALKTFLDIYYSHPGTDPETVIRAAVVAANRYVLDVARAIPARRGMGTTLTALIVLQDTGYAVQVGDSRAFRLRDGAFEQLTVDHTWIEDVVAMGIMSREAAEVHQNRHMITRAIGIEDLVQPDIFEFALQAGDFFVLCSDGVMNHVSNDQIGEIASSRAPSDVAWKLVNAALLGGGSDNTTVVAVRIDSVESTEG